MTKFFVIFFLFILFGADLSSQPSSQPAIAGQQKGRDETETKDYYPNPGIVGQRGGRWIGSDHLYNLTDKIGVQVEIFMPESLQIPVTEEMLRERISKIFEKGGITPITEAMPGEPMLPFFHMLVMVYPVEKGYVAFCEGRLFEKIHLNRVELDKLTTMQGITWESQNLMVAPHDQLEKQLYGNVDEIANTFVDRFHFYEEIRRKIQK